MMLVLVAALGLLRFCTIATLANDDSGDTLANPPAASTENTDTESVSAETMNASTTPMAAAAGYTTLRAYNYWRNLEDGSGSSLYKNDVIKRWILQTSDAQCPVLIQFLRTDVEGSNFDDVFIKENPFADPNDGYLPLVGKRYLAQIGPVEIYFQTDSSVRYQGWTLKFRQYCIGDEKWQYNYIKTATSTSKVNFADPLVGVKHRYGASQTWFIQTDFHCHPNVRFNTLFDPSWVTIYVDGSRYEGDEGIKITPVVNTDYYSGTQELVVELNIPTATHTTKAFTGYYYRTC